ncbi:type II toxin-antitoxin system RelE/ParE family toxin [Carnobacterium maltaromaticum]|uniref:type II toxin-antitoxin system RelE/ParE family toxin n=1 Tax=Carnobacterium maltaromaticum TaxID=2751 RepID=UPI00295E4BBA|nr:type II toxin-antitoxin system RelE/ParE family toxin [Carnobacterium maltaromaticum]
MKYLKKIKDRKLKEKFVSIIYDEIANDPFTGEQKTGDLKGFWTMGFTTYRVAYMIIEDAVIPILLVGTHENFYEELKRK